MGTKLPIPHTHLGSSSCAPPCLYVLLPPVYDTLLSHLEHYGSSIVVDTVGYTDIRKDPHPTLTWDLFLARLLVVADDGVALHTRGRDLRSHKRCGHQPPGLLGNPRHVQLTKTRLGGGGPLQVLCTIHNHSTGQKDQSLQLLDSESLLRVFTHHHLLRAGLFVGADDRG